MAIPFMLGYRSWWMAMFMVTIVCGTMAAPQQQERRKIKVGASFGGLPDSAGSIRALSNLEEPFIITEPLPGQEFVFISANPGQSQAAGGRAARVNPVTSQLPSFRIENSGSGTILEDGILIAEHLGESNRAGRLLDEPSGEPNFPVADAGVQSWTPLSLPELLTGPAIVRELDLVSSTESKVSTHTEKEFSSFAIAPVAEKFSLEDAVTAASVEESIKQDAVTAVAEDTVREGKAIDVNSQDDDNIIAAESVSRRTVVKTAPNGQDYEYEYLYYDGIDVDESNGTTLNAPLEPTLFTNDQENVSVLSTSVSETDKKVAPVVQIPLTTEDEVSVTTESDLVEVQEIPHVAHVAFQVGDVAQVDNIDFGDHEITTEDFDTTIPTEATTEMTTTTTTTTTTTSTTPMPKTTVTSRRRRPTTKPTATETPSVRPSLSRLTPLRKGNTPVVTGEPVSVTQETKKMRGKNRFSSDSVQSSNTLATEGKSDGAGNRRISRPRIRPSTSSTLENRAGLAEVRFAELEGEISLVDSIDVNDPSSIVVDVEDSLDNQEGFDFNRQIQQFEHFPINGRIPSHFEDNQETDEFSVQGRTPLRVVESDSFRISGNQGSALEQPLSVGRLTVISGPARLPAPSVPQFEDIAEKEEIISPTMAPEQEITENIQVDELEADITKDHLAVEPEVFEITDHEVETDVNKHKDGTLPFTLNHPSLTDLLAFSKAAEQQQQDDEFVQSVPAVEEVVIEEVIATTAAPTSTPSIVVVSQVQSVDDQFITQLNEDAEIPIIQDVNEKVVDFVDEIVTTPEPMVLSIGEVQMSLENNVDVSKTTDSAIEDVALEEEVHNTVAEAAISTTTSITTTTTTTTAATTTTPEPTTTTAATIRTPSRFSGSNANRFNNRIRNRVRGGTDESDNASTAATTTTAAPVRKNTFRPAVSPFNRLRRPTPSTDSAKSEAAVVEANESSSPVSVVLSTTRNPLTNNFRNRFQFRRNQTEVSKPAESSVVSQEPKTSTVRPRPTAQQSNRIASPRPMSSILKRGRFTTTSTTETAPVVTSVEEVSTNETVSETETTNDAPEKSDGEAVENAEPVAEKIVVTEATTTTTTSRSAGLNRLRNRVSLPVSERPKTVRTQVSLSDRRNRFSVLSNKKSEVDSSATIKEEPEKAITSDGQEEEATGNTNKAGTDESADSESNVEAAVTVAPVSSLRNRRPNRIPGQLVTRRT